MKYFLNFLAISFILLVQQWMFDVEASCYRQLDPESREIWHRIRHEWEDIDCFGYANNYSFSELLDNPPDCFVAHNCYIQEFGKDDRNDIRGCTDIGWHGKDYCNEYTDRTAKAKLSDVCESCRQCSRNNCNGSVGIAIDGIYVMLVPVVYVLLMLLLSIFNL